MINNLIAKARIHLAFQVLQIFNNKVNSKINNKINNKVNNKMK